MAVILSTLHRGLFFLLAVTAFGCVPSPVIPPGEVDISMRGRDRLTYLPLQMNGKRGYFLIDTGCSITDVSADQFINHVRVWDRAQVDSAGADGKAFVETVSPPTLDVGPFRLNNLSAVWMSDLTAASEVAGVRVWGALGGDCFSTRVLRIDPDARRISLLPAGSPVGQDWGTQLNAGSGARRC